MLCFDTGDGDGANHDCAGHQHPIDRHDHVGAIPYGDAHTDPATA